MKAMFIAYNQAYNEEIVDLLAAHGQRGFTRIESVQRYPAPGGKFLPPKNAIGWDRGHLHCYYTFLDAVAHGRTPENGIAEGAKLQTLMGKMVESDRTGRWVEV